MRVEPFSIQEKWRERWHFQCKCDLKSDIQFKIRMIFVSSYLLTNSLIVLGNTQIPFVRNWVRLSVYHGEVQCSKSFRQSPGKCYHKCTPWQSDYYSFCYSTFGNHNVLFIKGIQSWKEVSRVVYNAWFVYCIQHG